MARPQPRFWQRLFGGRKPPPILVVSGLPRSGTSMMMQMLTAGGLEAVSDHLRQSDTDNPRGYFEYEPVKTLADDASWLPVAQGKVVKIVSNLLQYLSADQTYKVIFMERNLQEIVASQNRMLENRGKPAAPEDDAAMTANFTRHLGQVKTWLRQQDHIDVLYLRYADVVAEPEAAVKRIQTFLGQPLHIEAMLAEVHQQLYRNRAASVRESREPPPEPAAQ